MPSANTSEPEISPITAEIIRHQLISIPNQIDVNITQTAFSPLVYEYKDYAVGIVDPEGRLVAQSNGGIPIFFANALGVAVQDGLKVHGTDGVDPGDVFISNHAGTLGQHLNNVVMYAPVHVEGELIAFMAVLVHWIDIGGAVVGSCISHQTTDIWQEGLQFRSVKLWRRGKPVKDILGIIEANTRFPRMLMGDLNSQLAGCLRGKEMIAELYIRHSSTLMKKAIAAMWQRSDHAARAVIRSIPNGTYRASSFLDNDGIDLQRKVAIEVIVIVNDEEIEVDLSGVSDQVKGPINSGRDGGAVTAARIAFKYLASPDEPANEGSFRPLKVTIPDGKFLSAKPGAPMGGYSMPLPTVIDTILRAMVSAMPGHLAGGHYGTFGGHTFFGQHPQSGELFQNLGASGGGWGASANHDGPGPFKTMAHGDTLDVPVEVQEFLYPLRIDAVRFRTDSGGVGEFRGGLGLEKVYTVLAPCTIRCAIDRTTCAPWGVLGGRDGQSSSNVIERFGQPPRQVLKGFVELTGGDVVRVLTGGGGGYGDPLARKTFRVSEDLRSGYVSQSQACTDYGVVLNEDGTVAEKATAALRSQLKQGAAGTAAASLHRHVVYSGSMPASFTRAE